MKTVQRRSVPAIPLVLLVAVLAALAAIVAACGGATSAGPATSATATGAAGSLPSSTERPSAAPASDSAAMGSQDPGASAPPSVAASGSTAGAASSPSAAAATLPPLPHVLLSINEQGAYRGIVSAATWAPTGPGSSRAFGSGVPAADSLRQLRARIGSVLTIAVDGRPIGKVELYAAPLDRFAGKLTTSSPFGRLRFTSSRVTSGERVPFWAPDGGEWVVYARVTFADGAGSGTWLWRVLIR